MAIQIDASPVTVFMAVEQGVLCWEARAARATERAGDDEWPAHAVPPKVSIEFTASGKSFTAYNNATRLALAVLEGDRDAALLLADLVQEEYLAAKR
jgi:hypothetical protein